MTPPRRRVPAKPNPKPAERTVGDEYKILLAMLEQQNRSIDGLRAVVSQGHEKSSESRAKLHERIDEVGEKIARLEGSVGILGHVDGQVRHELDGLKTALNQHKEAIDPTVENWRELMKSGKRISWAFSIAGITTIGGLIAVVTGVFDWVGGWVRARGWM